MSTRCKAFNETNLQSLLQKCNDRNETIQIWGNLRDVIESTLAQKLEIFFSVISAQLTMSILKTTLEAFVMHLKIGHLFFQLLHLGRWHNPSKSTTQGLDLSSGLPKLFALIGSIIHGFLECHGLLSLLRLAIRRGLLKRFVRRSKLNNLSLIETQGSLGLI
ncbi:hypothetical protein ACFE04_002671 [Oxalis oulophora]